MIIFTGTFLLALFAFVIGASTPGPATMLIAATSMERGRPAGLATVAGISCGSCFWGLMAASGFAVALQTYAWVAEALRVIGGSYLIYLAFKAGRAVLRAETLPEVEAANGQSLFVYYRRGLLFHLTNPKAIFVWLSAIAIAIPHGAPAFQAFVVVVVLEMVAIAIFISYGFLFATAPARNAYKRIKRWVDGFSAAVFGAFGFGLILQRS